MPYYGEEGYEDEYERHRRAYEYMFGQGHGYRPPAPPPDPPPAPIKFDRHNPCPRCRLFLLVRHCWLLFRNERPHNCDTWVCVSCGTLVSRKRVWHWLPSSPLFEPMNFDEEEGTKT